MTRTIPLAVLAVLVVGSARGQDPKAAATAKAAEMTEDVEILRLLLNKAFGFDRPPGAAAAWSAAGLPHVSPGGGDRLSAAGGSGFSSWATQLQAQQGPMLPEAFDGVYLKGHGVAYTVRLASPTRAANAGHAKADGLVVTCQNCHPAADVAKFNLKAAAAAKPPTEWEKARDELRGGAAKLDPAAPRANVADMCLPGSLTETVTKLLAVNGRHVRHLAADESVSVIVTYDGVTGPAHDRTTGTLADPNLWDPKAPTPTPFGLTPDEAKQIVLGDLHLKQGKYDEAAKAYEFALARYPATINYLDPPKHAKPAERDAAFAELQKSVAAAYRSLAQAYLGGGNLDEAKRALNLAQQLKIEPTGGAKKATTPVPAKIVLTVKKGHLDAADKLSPAEFRKGVTVEMVGLSVGKK